MPTPPADDTTMFNPRVRPAATMPEQSHANGTTLAIPIMVSRTTPANLLAQGQRRRKYDGARKLQFREMIILMRYHTPKPTTSSHVFASYASIQRITGVPYSTVRTISLKALEKPTRSKR